MAATQSNRVLIGRQNGRRSPVELEPLLQSTQLRALEESASLYRKLANQARNVDLTSTISRWEEHATTAEMNAHTLRDFLVNVNASRHEYDDMTGPDRAVP